jgi:predicted Zn-dependent protease
MARTRYLSVLSLSIFVIFLSFPQPSFAGGLISTGLEVEIGKSVRDEILSENELWEDPYDNELVQKLAEAVLPYCDQRDIEYEFYVIESDEINAFALPGGFIFITNGLLDFANRDPGLIAGVLAHEIGHVALRHHKKSMEDALWQNLGLAVLFEAFDIDEEWIQIAGAAALLLVQQGYSRDNEYEADRHGVRATYRAGFDPETGLVEFLGMIEEKYGSDNDLGDVGRSLQSHPDTDRRVFFAENYLTELKAVEEFHPQPFPEIEAKPAANDGTYPEDEDKPGQYVIYQGDKD